MIKLVAADLDGTLLNNNNEITSKTLNTVKSLKEKNIEFLICTGREYGSTKEILDRYDIKCSCICDSGATAYSKESLQLDRVIISEDIMEIIIETFNSYNVQANIITNKGAYMVASKKEIKEFYHKVFPQIMEINGIKMPICEINKKVDKIHSVNDVIELLDRDIEIYKVTGISLGFDALKNVRNKLEDFTDLAIASSFPTNIEVTNFYAQKGIALKKYISQHNIAMNEVMVIGDSENDASMIKLDFKYTIAMGNAVPEFQKKAKYITKSNEADGVAYAIETWI